MSHDLEIEGCRNEIDALTKLLDEQAIVVREAAVVWICDWWESQIRRVVRDNPERAEAARDRLPALKQRLAELRASAPGLVDESFASFVLHTGELDDLVGGGLRSSRQWGPMSVRPDARERLWDPTRKLADALAPALIEAGLDPVARYSVDLSPDLLAAAGRYDELMAKLLKQHSALRAAERAKAEDAATTLWDEA